MLTILSAAIQQEHHSSTLICSGFSSAPNTAQSDQWKGIVANLTDVTESQMLGMSTHVVDANDPNAPLNANLTMACRSKNGLSNGDPITGSCNAALCIKLDKYPNQEFPGTYVGHVVVDTGMHKSTGIIIAVSILGLFAGMLVMILKKNANSQRKGKLAEEVATAVLRQYGTQRGTKELSEDEFFAFASGTASLAFFRQGNDGEPE